MKNEVLLACAGSGKTHALIQRLLALLKGGAAPGEILAITFTNKAAQEIRQRLLAELDAAACAGESWAQQVNLRILLEQSPADRLSIHTFHSWFGVLLEGKHWTRGWYGPAQIVEEAAEKALREQAWEACVDLCPEQQAFLLRFCTPKSLKALLCETVVKNLNAWRLLALPAMDTQQSEDAWHTAHAQHQQAQAAAVDATNRLITAMDDEPLADDEEAKAAASYLYTQAGGLRKPLIKKAEKKEASKQLQAADAAHQQVDIAEDALVDCAMKTLLPVYLEKFQQLKDKKNVMSFDDLEYHAYCFVEAQGDINRALYRLSQQYKHILVDEFQDCNPLQWHLLKHWLHATHGGAEAPSVFIVGDEKQAIYRFRRGDSRLLGEASGFLQTHYQAKVESENRCRRCAKPVLDVVNNMFAGDSTADVNYAKHTTATGVNDARAGRVEWHIFHADALAKRSGMRNPLREPLAESTSVQHWADAIATRLSEVIGHWQIDDATSKDGKRLCRADDCMVLMHYATHAHHLAHALQMRGIAYSLQGRGNNFLQRLACRDILALLQVLDHPQHSLLLAQVLKSPLFSYSDEQLNAMAIERDLWASLCADPAHRETVEVLTRWQQWLRTQHLPVHDLLTRLYHEHGVIRRYQQAMPARAVAVREELSALLDYALLCDGGRKPLVETFLTEARRAIQEDKAPIPTAHAGVQLMTIHKAKGLEAAVVVIADTTMDHDFDITDRTLIDFLIDWQPQDAKPQAVHFCLRRDTQPAPARATLVDENRARSTQELKNLWYVAMTRARHGLIIFSKHETRRKVVYKHASQFVSGGEFNKDAVPAAGASAPNYQKLLAAMCQLQTKTKARPDSLSFAYGDSLAADDAAAAATKDAGDEESERKQLAQWTPSAQMSNANAKAMQSGKETHQALGLLLSGVDPKTVVQIDPSLSPQNITAAEQLVASAQLAELLSGCTRYQVECEFWDAKGRAHRIDLLIDHPDGIWIIDYKSGQADAATHTEQLQRYKDVVATAYPNRSITTAILTPTGHLETLTI